MTTITIDCGASFIKGGRFVGKDLIRTVERKAPSFMYKSNELANCFCINRITALVHMVKEILIELAADDNEIVLAISNEMHGFILTDKDGVPVIDYISWQHEFGSLKVDGITSCDMINGLPAEYVIHSGMPIRSGLPSSNLLFLIREGSIFKSVHDGFLFFYTLGDYIIRSLSDKQPFCNPTNAAATGLYDLTMKDWNWDYIKKLGGKNIVFPVINNINLDFELKNIKIHVKPAIGDQQAALLGAGLSKPGELSFNLGTGAQVSRLSSEVVFSGRWQIRPYFYGYYLKTIPHIPSGRALNVFFRFIKDILSSFNLNVSDDEIWEIMIRSVEAIDESDLQIDLGFFENTVNKSTKGSIRQISESNLNMGGLMNSILLQMSENYIKMANVIEPNRNNVEKVIFSGGISRKIEFIRNKISSYYGVQDVNVSENETLHGLYIYSRLA